MSTYFKAIKEARIKRNLTQQQVGDALGVTKSHVGKIEMGQRGLSLDFAIKLADFYGISLDELVGRK